jgi:hypothetical protein
MQSAFINSYIIPANVRQQYAKYLSLDLYTDRLVGKGSPNGDITYFFKDYMTVTWTPASLATQFAQVVFITHENASRYITGGNLNSLVDLNKIPFCSGMFSYVEANNYAKFIYMEIKKAMDAFKSQEDKSGTTVQINFSAADEIRKFKELLDIGAITEEEFNEKKNALLSGAAPAVPSEIPAAPAAPPIIAAPTVPQNVPALAPVPQQAAPAGNAIKFCPRCGAKQEQPSNFCPRCGNKLR